jgi:hypothetical protein
MNTNNYTMKNIFNNIINQLFIRCSKTGKIVSFRKPGFFTIIPFVIIGLVSLLWLLIRVIPKPSRATYPCMKVAMPLAFSFLTYLAALGASVLFFRKAVAHFRTFRYKYALLFFVISIALGIGSMIYQAMPSVAMEVHSGASLFEDPLGPNTPIGEPKGIYPGRVVWAFDPNATNKNCTNSSHSDAYWLDKNCDQEVVDRMFSDGIKALTGKESHPEAWDTIFRYFNMNHGKGDIGYTSDETIFIKINAVTAWSGAEPDGIMPSGAAIEFDTSPQAILALLRQLVNEAGVPEQNIFIGDPMADIWNTLYDKFYAEFPDINYTSKRTITGRYKLTPGEETGIFYSDKGTVMDQLWEVPTNMFFQEMMDADYLLNVPTMKGHRWGGVTMFAKNHFGSNTTDGSWRLHKGLMKPDSDPLRTGYNLYRVFVDLMASKYLGGNTLLYYMDALWSTSYEHQKPQKFRTAPFNSDWCSSLLFSLDPVAIESVGLDILQKEFTVEEIDNNNKTPDRYTYVQWEGVDDYLHQAADSTWWPEGITYDPDSSGTVIGSLGVHEHWNNTTDMEYSVNLGTGEGIELIKLFQIPVGVEQNEMTVSLEVFPNPVNITATIRFNLSGNGQVRLDIYSIDGKLISTLVDHQLQAGEHQVDWNPENVKGHFVVKLILSEGSAKREYTTKIQVL